MKCYTNETEKNIIYRAKQSVGLTINEILKNNTLKINLKNKGNIGNIIEEYWFGIKNNSSPLPDFEVAEIELKVIPLIQNKDNSYSVKERTKICSINYNTLIKETWESSHAKKKINKILFIYYVYNKSNIVNSFIKKIDLFRITDSSEPIIKADWNKIHKFVSEGNAHTLSESISNILAASRSGSGGKKPDGTAKDLVIQPNSSVYALKRAFSFKQSFTNQRWNELNNKRYESILKILTVNSDNFEDEIINKISELKNLTLRQVADRFEIKVPNGKNAAATIVKKAIGFKNVNSKIKEFEQIGISIKIISVGKKDYMPYEAVSFPTFKFKELIKERFYEGETEFEEWDSCTLLKDLNRILFIPVLKDELKDSKVEDKKIGQPFFWSPSNEELILIEKEWENYIKEINDGKVKITRKPVKNGYQEINGLIGSKYTKIIHIRPHAKDRSDRDEDHLGNSIVKQSFWLNKEFLQKLLKKNK